MISLTSGKGNTLHQRAFVVHFRTKGHKIRNVKQVCETKSDFMHLSDILPPEGAKAKKAVSPLQEEIETQL
jgi:hypothetical protein